MLGVLWCYRTRRKQDRALESSKLTVSDAKRLVIDASMTPQSRFSPKGPSAGMIDNVTKVLRWRCEFPNNLVNFGMARIRKLLYICVVILFTADVSRP